MRKITNGNGFACLRTARSAAAIGSIEVWGEAAAELIGRVFRPNTGEVSWEPGQLHYGHFVERDEIVDDGIVGCEGPGRFALHSHGNPLILQRLLRLLEAHGAQIIPLEEMLLRRYRAESSNLIEAEAKAESLKAVSLEGMKLIRAQVSQGLAAVVRQWMDKPNPDVIRKQAAAILDRSRIAERLIRPVKVLLTGPPNSGKSTLLNRLAGREEALVADIPGTTRDWVSAFGRIGPLVIEWIDTAGLDERLRKLDALEQAAQAATLDLLKTADLILYLLDASKPGTVTPFRGADIQKQVTVPGFAGDVPVLVVWNKCDLTPQRPSEHLCISAQTGQGIEELAKAVLKVMETETLVPGEPIAFTPRQTESLQNIVESKTEQELQKQLNSLYNP
jgi:tRNA modification GTPase